MMGRREGGQGQFLYSFDLDKVVPPDHLVRQIDGVSRAFPGSRSAGRTGRFSPRTSWAISAWK
jgi:hypothetical protein